MINQNIYTMLQKNATKFLQNYYLMVKDVAIYPKEIEAYYFKSGIFEDCFVHQNDMQANRYLHFYIHRYGETEESLYIEGTRGGCDLVISNEDYTYYSFLIRSIVIDDKLIVGPRRSLNAILSKTNFTNDSLEQAEVKLMPCEKTSIVLPCKRIGLGDYNNEYKDAELRFILCDDYFKKKDPDSNAGYPKRTDAIDNYLKNKLQVGEYSKEQAIKFSKQMYGSVSRWLREY